MDSWLKWMAILGPIFGLVFGVCSGAVITYQAFKADGSRITLIEGWREKQEEFNKVIIGQIATLNEISKRVR